MRAFLALYSSFFLMTLATALAEHLPQMRPALMGNGPNSLVNLIDTAKLMKRDQGDGVIRFSCYVSPHGEINGMVTYRRSDNTDALAEEAIYECRHASFIPAIYDSRPAWAEVGGTIMFVVIKGKPHLRIFLNQEPEHLKKGDDFISPQEIYRRSDNFYGFTYPSDPTLSGTVIMKLNIDATGKLLGAKVALESPVGAGFGASVMKRINRISFLPGYLHGQPVACSTDWEILFRGNRAGTYWNGD